jgi:hypothetical protein
MPAQSGNFLPRSLPLLQPNAVAYKEQASWSGKLALTFFFLASQKALRLLDDTLMLRNPMLVLRFVFSDDDDGGGGELEPGQAPGTVI